MKFIILKLHGSYIVEAEDFDGAAEAAYNNHTGWNDVMAIVKMEETE